MSNSFFNVSKGLEVGSDSDVAISIINGDPYATDPQLEVTNLDLFAMALGSKLTNTVNGDEWKKVATSASPGSISDWVKTTDATGGAAEDGFQNTFMGKSGVGTETPTYSGGNSSGLSSGTNLEQAIDTIDNEIGVAITPVTRTNNNPTNAGITVNANIDALDAAIGDDVVPVTRLANPLLNTNDIGANLEAIDAQLGTDAELTGANYVNTGVGVSINDNLLSLDGQVKINADGIAALTNNLAWREKVIAITEDGDLQSATEGATLSTLLPFSDDEGTQMVIGDFSADDFILSRNTSGTDRLWQVYDDTGTLKITLIGFNAIVDYDTFIVKNDLVDSPASQENAAIYHYNGTDLVKIADVDWSLASGIDIDSGYAAVNGTVDNTDTVLSAIQKLAGNQLDITSLTGVSQGAVDLGTFSGTIIPDSSAIKPALQALETDVEAIQTLTGVSAEATDLGTFTGDTITDNTVVTTALQDLEVAHEKARLALTETAVTTERVIDSVVVDDVRMVTWRVVCHDDSNNKVKAFTVNAIHDGDSTTDAGLIDKDITNLRIGTNITGLTLDVDLDGNSGAAQRMELKITSTDSVRVTATRYEVHI
jgi:hypothetical protein